MELVDIMEQVDLNWKWLLILIGLLLKLLLAHATIIKGVGSLLMLTLAIKIHWTIFNPNPKIETYTMFNMLPISLNIYHLFNIILARPHKSMHTKLQQLLYLRLKVPKCKLTYLRIWLKILIQHFQPSSKITWVWNMFS